MSDVKLVILGVVWLNSPNPDSISEKMSFYVTLFQIWPLEFTPIYRLKTKIIKIYTHFQPKTARKPNPLGLQIPI